jgi:hypothetical protein
LTSPPESELPCATLKKLFAVVLEQIIKDREEERGRNIPVPAPDWFVFWKLS